MQGPSHHEGNALIVWRRVWRSKSSGGCGGVLEYFTSAEHALHSHIAKDSIYHISSFILPVIYYPSPDPYIIYHL